MFYAREPYSNVDAVHVTRFIGLAPVGNKDKQVYILSTISNNMIKYSFIFYLTLYNTGFPLLLRNFFMRFLPLQHLLCLQLRFRQKRQTLPCLHTRISREQLMQKKVQRGLVIVFLILIHSTGGMMSPKKGRNMEMVIGCALSLFPPVLVHEGKLATFNMTWTQENNL